MAAHYAIAAARQVTPGDECYAPAGVAENLTKLRLELDRMEASRYVPNGDERLEHVKRHVSNLMSAAETGTPPGSPELWTLSIAIDYLGDHLVTLLEADIRQKLAFEGKPHA